ncbi:hypothetical protein B5E79_08410 [Massilimicrobiota sp. An134]|nr:hypothetical protein B5E79_08410 [Massilimicrobiota sp. An134]
MIVGGATPSTKQIQNYENGNISWITPKDLSCFKDRYIDRGERNITELGLKSCSTRLIPKNSILFSSRAPIGYIAIANKELCTNQGFKSIVPNENIDYLFLYYLLKYNKSNIENIGSGTTFKEVSATVMKHFEVKIPKSKNEQRKIASILDLIDNKIELNNKINNNLEQQLCAIFKELFSEYIDSLTESSTTLGDLVTSIDNRGKTPPLSSEPTNYPIIDVRALSGTSRIVDYNNCTKYVLEETYNSWFRSGHPKPYDILISTVGSLAEMKIYLGNIGCIAQNVVGFRSKGISPLYIYQYLNYIKNDLVSYNIGSVQPSIKVTHIVKHPIYVPSEEKLNSFDIIARAMTEEIYSNSKEIEKLKLLRDTLLPKLMSGEIDVSDIEF